jgi:hypothetical protein
MSNQVTKRSQVILYSSGIFVFFGFLYAHVYQHTTHHHEHDELNETALAPTHDCTETTGHTIEVTINNNIFSPDTIVADLCDTLKITNLEETLHEPASGPHPTHNSYPEINSPKVLQKNESYEAPLIRSGEYSFHDHLNEKIEANLIVRSDHDHSTDHQDHDH